MPIKALRLQRRGDSGLAVAKRHDHCSLCLWSPPIGRRSATAPPATGDRVARLLRDFANERRRFGYRHLFIPLGRGGEPSGVNRIYGSVARKGLRCASSGETGAVCTPRSNPGRGAPVAGFRARSIRLLPALQCSTSSTTRRVNAWWRSRHVDVGPTYRPEIRRTDRPPWSARHDRLRYGTGFILNAIPAWSNDGKVEWLYRAGRAPLQNGYVDT